MTQSIVSGYEDIWISAADYNVQKSNANQVLYNVKQFVIKRVSDGAYFFGVDITFNNSTSSYMDVDSDGAVKSPPLIEVKDKAGTILSSPGYTSSLSVITSTNNKLRAVWPISNNVDKVRLYGNYAGYQIPNQILLSFYYASTGYGASFATSETVIGTFLNRIPTITISSPSDNQTLSEASQYIFSGSVSDTDPGNQLSIKYSIGGGPTQSFAIGTSDGVNPVSFSKTLTYSNGRFWDGSTDVSGLLPAEAASIFIWVNDGIDDSPAQTKNFTVTQQDGKVYVPVNVVSTSYLVSQMARPVMLSNKWLVGGVYDSTNKFVYFYVSKDNGKNWAQLCYQNTGLVGGVPSLAARDTRVYALIPNGNNYRLNVWTFDAATQTNTNLTAYTIADDNQSGSITTDTGYSNAITPNGSDMWFTLASKNTTYANSYNIRAGRIPINADGSLGTSVTAQRTALNTSSDDYKNPAIICHSNNKVTIVAGYKSGTTTNQINSWTYDGTGWNGGTVLVYSGGAYAQSNLTVITTPNGKLHTAWNGTSAVDAVNPWIYYSNSADGTNWLTTSKKLVKGQNASITSDKNGKLFIEYEDAGVIKRIESTDEFTTWTSATVGTGTKPAALYDPTFATDFTVPPTIYQSTNSVKYCGAINVNQAPTLTLTTMDNQTLTEQATLAVSGSMTDPDNGNVVTVYYKINNGPPQAAKSDVSDGSTPISFARTLTYQNKRIYLGGMDIIGSDLAENTDHSLIVWSEDNKGGKSTEQTRKFRVVWNRPPTIEGSNSDLGTIEDAPSIAYSIADPETNPFTVTEKINGVVIRTFNGGAGRQETLTIPKYTWLRLEPGVQHTLTIEATDNQSMTSTRAYTFTRLVDKIIFNGLDFSTLPPDIKAKFTTDVAAQRLLFTPVWDLPPGATLTYVEVCNNAYDANPAWEDATIVVKLNRAHLFENTTKTAEQWGINFRYRIDKATAISPIRAKGGGGAFD